MPGPASLLVLALLLPWRGARAEDPPPPEEERDLPGFAPVQPVPDAKPRSDPPSGPFAALGAAACLPLDDLGPGARLGLDVGAQLPWLGGRLLPAAEIEVAGAAASGRIAGGSLAAGAPLAWSLRLAELGIGGGLRVRGMDSGAAISPEVGAGLAGVRVLGILAGDQGGQALEPVREATWSLGWRATAGVAVRLGPGRLVLDLGYRHLRLGGVLTGQTASAALLAGLGYRVRAW